MYRIRLSIAFGLLSIACVENVEAMDCTPADIQLSSQSDVDNFQADYGPDCDTITGNLTIVPVDSENGSDTVSLDSLTGLRVIHGGLVVQDNPALTEISGLADLVSVGGDLEVRNNESLSDCQALIVVLDGFHDGVFEPVYPVPDVGGQINVGDNAEGCNSVEEIAPRVTKAEAMTGSWYVPSAPGVGLMWHAVSDEIAVAYYYGFDEEGDRLWLVGIHEGPIEWGNLINFDVVYVVGGRFQNFQPALISENHWGEIELILYNCHFATITTTGVFPGTTSPASYFRHLERVAPVAGNRCYRASYIADPTDGLTGSWFDANKSGQGFSIHKVDDDTGIVYFYGFDRAGKPLWLIGVWDGSVRFGEQMTVDMLEVSGGRFFPAPWDLVEESEWGILRIRFDGCTTGWAELFGADGHQEFELGLLAGSAGLECENQ